MKAEKSPFDVKLAPEALKELTDRLVEELRGAKRARSTHMDDLGYLDFAWHLYEQRSQMGISRDSPRFGRADLTSPIGTENVDAISARAVKTVFVEPLYIVEGIGKASTNAPIVEEFMQWRQERMRLQKVCKRAFASAFVETGAILEVCEDAECVTRVEVVQAEVQRDAMGATMLDPDNGKPLPLLDEEGLPVPAADPQAEHVEVKRTYEDYKRRGAYVRRRSMKDFVFLPSHAEDDREVWGHATRFYQTLREVKQREKAKEYSKEAVAALGGSTHERDPRSEQERQGITMEVSHGEDLIEKELWRVQFWWSINGKQSCYIAVVSEIHSAILQLRMDPLQRWRTIYLNPYPCPYSVYGYSMILTKLLTMIEEHTAWRNMNADRGTLKANAPLKRLHGAQWDPELQPFGAGQVVDVANMNEIMPFEFEDVTVQALNKEQQCVADAQRVIGLNDIAIGQQSEKSRTLGENEMATRESFTRTDDPIGNLQEAMEELGEVIHAIEVMTLREMDGEGIEAPASVTDQIQLKGDTSFDGTFTAEMVGPIDGYRFKPRGSVESADPNRRMKMMVNGIDWLAKISQVNPQVALRMQSPEIGDALMQQYVTEWKPRDKAPFLTPVQPPMMLPPGAAPPGAEGPGAPPQAMQGQPGMPNFGGQELMSQLLSQVAH